MSKAEKMKPLSLNEINRSVLRKQCLTGQSGIDDVVEIVKAIGGLHATSPTTPYLSLLARTRHFDREHLNKELHVKRSLAKIRYVRTTLYILPKEMISTAFAATKAMAEPASQAYSKFLGITDEKYVETSKRIKEILKGHGGMTTKLIKQKLGLTLNVSPIVNLMCDQGLLIRGPPEIGWKSNIHTYFLFDEYFPDVKLEETDEEEARKTVVLQYISCFGPVTENDVSWWTGFPRSQVKRIIHNLGDKVNYVEISDVNKNYFVLSADMEFLSSAKDTKRHMINVLPSLDPYLMGFKDRERYLHCEHYNYIFDRSGNATSSILIDGQIIGVWDFEEPFVKIFLFDDDFEGDTLKEIRLKAKSAGTFISGKEAQVQQCDSMIPLTGRSAGAVMKPLKGC